VNATTSYDETVYALQVRPIQPAVIERALTILEEWASQVTFDTAAIEGARGRARRMAIEARGRRACRTRSFRSSCGARGYANRNPIGTPESIQTFKPDRLRQFYAGLVPADLDGRVCRR
jgi:zinc protease